MPVKFQHTRALLANIARDNEGVQPGVLISTLDGLDDDDDGGAAVSSSILAQVSTLLQHDNEDGLKSLLKSSFGVPDDDDVLEHYVMDLMHKHNDLSDVPFTHLTPRRPISRPSSRASSPSARLIPPRPETPNSQVSASSPLAYAFRRPHTPVMSPLAAGSHVNASSYLSARPPPIGSYGSDSSPPLLYSAAAVGSRPESPAASPRLLNAKAAEFKPGPRPLSAASNRSISRKETASPDLWSSGIGRSTSNLAIAAPLLPDPTLLSSSTWPTSGSAPATPTRLPQEPDPEEDEFSPFAPPKIRTPAAPENDHASNSTGSYDLSSADSDVHYNPYAAPYVPQNQLAEPEDYGFHNAPPQPGEHPGDGMTPFDVLTSVFGSTVPAEDLEDALARNGYDFDTTMAWLIERRYPQNEPIQHPAIRGPHSGAGRVYVVPRETVKPPPPIGKMPLKLSASKSNTQGPPNRVCRYFLAGECLRADCKFSHDIERALCRFWLRGTCAKNENCEFLHHLPEQWDQSVKDISTQLNQSDFVDQPSPAGTPVDEFPILSQELISSRNGSRRGGPATRGTDPSRARFALAVKKAAQQSPANMPPPTLGAHFATTPRGANGSGTTPTLRSGPAVPRASPRIKLRPPSLLPTLSTGAALNEMYLAYRARAIKLGAERHACLSRAAEAWRRGDGAAAKQFSLQGAELNAKMGRESGDAVARLMRERSRLSVDAVRNREASWSDDPRDRTERGKLIGGSLGVCLGVAAKPIDPKATPDERMESVLDLHGLHATEATEVLETFLLSLETEHYFGLGFLVVGEEKHTGTQDPLRGASRLRLAAGVRDWLHKWGYPWSERDGIICVDPLTHAT
ncbi:hypothetical protein BKA62DRAFT_747811 [Auriculariales sp. MPI-PUGE-AT-0066]|nr:hypothetical protein BKA62DRAFT_747811 [Auriculariales sp. MPI-PUGE-AT-0066]